MSKFYGVVKNGVLIGMKEVHSVIASTSHKRLTKEEYKLRSVGDTFDGEVWTAKADAAYKTYTYDRFLKRS